MLRLSALKIIHPNKCVYLNFQVSSSSFARVVFFFSVLVGLYLTIHLQRGMHSRNRAAMELIAKGWSALKEVDRVMDDVFPNDPRLYPLLRVIFFFSKFSFLFREAIMLSSFTPYPSELCTLDALSIMALHEGKNLMKVRHHGCYMHC